MPIDEPKIKNAKVYFILISASKIKDAVDNLTNESVTMEFPLYRIAQFLTERFNPSLHERGLRLGPATANKHTAEQIVCNESGYAVALFMADTAAHAAARAQLYVDTVAQHAEETE